MKSHGAKLTIARTSGGGEDQIVVEVEDGPSGCRVLELKLTPADFALALTGRGLVGARMDFYDDCPVGRRREFKQETVTFQEGRTIQETRRNVRAAVAAFEADGWEGRDEDCSNWHNCLPDGRNAFRVGFVRYVEEKA